MEQLFTKNYDYPDQGDPDIQYDIYKKREFFSNKVHERPIITNYEDLKQYRDNACAGEFELLPHQTTISNFINPDTPYTGILLFHGLGTGKTCAAISVAEKFKDQVAKYNTKIYILVSGPLLKAGWRSELIKCTKNTYFKMDESIEQVDIAKRNKMALEAAMKYYKIVSYKSFYKHVLGEKIIEKQEGEKSKYKKNPDGTYERDLPSDRLMHLNNSLLIVDEAHNLTGNAYGEAVLEIIKKSTNLKVILLTATPMKNLADDIVDLMNLIRPLDDPIKRDRVFTGEVGRESEFREGGLEYLRKMVRGYVSHIRGSDPLIFAKRHDVGIKPPELLFTKLISCKMEQFQLDTYKKEIAVADDSLDKRTESIANFVFPCLDEGEKNLIGCFGKEGIRLILKQLKGKSKILNNMICHDLIQDKTCNSSEFIQERSKIITGLIMKEKYLKFFSSKFYKALRKLNRLVYGRHGSQTAFIYSNLVKVGVEIFQQVLLTNGYVEYQDNMQVNSDTRCYFCGVPYGEHSVTQSFKDKKGNIVQIPEHVYKPATFITVVGQAGEDTGDNIPEEKQKIIETVLNIPDNYDGKYIKFILGSSVMKEGINLKNIGEVHVLDVYYNFGRLDQVIGRAIRHCSHYQVMSKENPYPEVKVYKYVITLDGDLSMEEKLYQNAETKHLLIKKVERILKEESIDCALNTNGNMFVEETKEYENCEKNNACPSKCDYVSCDYKCSNEKLNLEYYDASRKIYKQVKDIDNSTYTSSHFKNEIQVIKSKIKEMYRFGYAYNLSSIMEYVKSSYPPEKLELFDEFFLYKALTELIPITESDFNTFNETIYDKYSNGGYLIFVNDFYVFQKYNRPKNELMYYRTLYDKKITTQIDLHEYLKTNEKYKQFKKSVEKIGKHKEIKHNVYEFDMKYYNSRDEYAYVGIIDKETDNKKNKTVEKLNDVFKLRQKRNKSEKLKRGIGIITMKGSVCFNAYERQQLLKIAKKLGITEVDGTRINICDKIRETLLELEKYGTTKDGNKYTYMMIPSNHPEYPFPYNLEDRVDYIIDSLNKKIPKGLKIQVEKLSKEKKYQLNITAPESEEETLRKMKATKIKDKWVINIE